MIDGRNIANTGTLSTATTVTLANAGRSGFLIQNQGTNPLFVSLGVAAIATPTGGTTGTYHVVLKSSGTVSDGSGGTFSMLGGSCYTGSIFCTGTGPTYTFLEY